MTMKVDFLKYPVIEAYGNAAQALTLIDKRHVKKTQVASHFASKQARESARGLKSKEKLWEELIAYFP
jgi:hypothetical protein